MLNTILGGFEVLPQVELVDASDEYKAMWKEAVGEMVGAGYKPVAVLVEQIVKGKNVTFLAEQTLVLKEPVRHIVLITINKFGREQATITSIERLF